jgi:hypothetical protein
MQPKQARYPATMFLGAFAFFGLMVGLVAGPCGDTLAQRAVSADAASALLVGSGLLIDRRIVARDARPERRDPRPAAGRAASGRG